MACVTTGFWCSSNAKMAMLSSMSSSPRISCSSRSVPMPPLNPRDPFLSKLVSVANSENPETPPHLNLFQNPLMVDKPDEIESAVKDNKHWPSKPPPDLRSLLLHGRIVYIGMPLVDAAIELVTAELLYLQWMDPNLPIYLYINSTGLIHANGKTVATEPKSFAIYDVMMQLTNEIQTVAVGAAIGQACLLLAAGKKGRRFILPRARVMIRPPPFIFHGIKPTSDVLLQINEATENWNMLAKLLARHTGTDFINDLTKIAHQSPERVTSVMRRPQYMSSMEAKDFGIVDEILWCRKEEPVEKMNQPKDQDRKAGI